MTAPWKSSLAMVEAREEKSGPQERVGRRLDLGLQAAHELGPGQAGRDRLQKFEDDGPRPAQEAVRGPVDPELVATGWTGRPRSR